MADLEAKLKKLVATSADASPEERAGSPGGRTNLCGRGWTMPGAWKAGANPPGEVGITTATERMGRRLLERLCEDVGIDGSQPRGEASPMGVPPSAPPRCGPELRAMNHADEQVLMKALGEFQERILAGHTATTIVREFITHGPSVVVGTATYTQLRERVGATLNVNPNRDVYMVGSAKLGFSIAPHKLWTLFGDESDVDLAVVSPELYVRLWSEVRRFTRGGGMWEGDSKRHLKNDHLAGVIKPKTLPDTGAIPTRRVLFDLAADLQRTAVSRYPLTIVVWHSMEALEDYQVAAVADCQRRLAR